MTDLTPEQLDALDAAATWLRECSGWLLSNDLDMTCPMETDPLDLADDLDAVVGHIIVAPVWQPIETAPKDGLYLIYQPPDEAGRFALSERICLNRDGGGIRKTTHWMPLPTPPKGE
jgi:hypothetical protein